MESARDKYTSEIIEAEELWILDVVDTNGYVCWGYGIEMCPWPRICFNHNQE
ncbi:hypothetical protein C7426_102655 [Pantoea ananatis]|nr:hypothetical protein C7426_102655 [Pantoea ananatis]